MLSYLSEDRALSSSRLVSGYQCKSPAGKGALGGWRLGFRGMWAAAQGEGGGAEETERGSQRRDRKER